MTSASYFGLDVSKARLDLADVDRHLARFPNTAQGHQDLNIWLQDRAVTAVGVESTGPYSAAVVRALTAAGFCVYVVQPGRVRWFARSQGIQAKTDEIDGQVIARYVAQSSGLRPYTPPSAEDEALRLLADRRDQVVDDRRRERCRLEASSDGEVRQMIEDHIAQLSAMIDRLEQRLDELIAKQATLARKSARLQDVTGVGRQTTTCLLAHLPELGRVNRQEISALAGLAPYPRDSGKHHGKRSVYGGRARVRRALYMAAVSASRHNLALKGLYARLIAKGKQRKLALIAVARKLLVHLNTIMRQEIAAIG